MTKLFISVNNIDMAKMTSEATNKVINFRLSLFSNLAKSFSDSNLIYFSSGFFFKLFMYPLNDFF